MTLKVSGKKEIFWSCLSSSCGCLFYGLRL